MKKKMDLDTTVSEKTGLAGIFESALRRFKVLMHIGSMIPVYLGGAALLGACLTPGVFLFRWMGSLTAQSSFWLQNFAYGFSLAVGFVLYGISLIFLAPLVNRMIGGRLAPWRGPYYSSESFRWYVHNALTYLARYTFLEFVTPSPLALLFYQMMGMKIGKGTVINSTWISDPSLIEMGEKVTIGGSVTIVAHYGQGGMLIIAPVRIGSRCTIGIKATLMGDTEIGEGAKVLPHSVVLPKTRIPAGETWGGVPAKKVSFEEPKELKRGA